MMKRETLKQVVKLADQLQHVFIVTVDANGWPYVAVTGQPALTTEEQMTLVDWFDPITMANLRRDPRMTLVVGEAAAAGGYQLLGEVERVKEMGILDGYIPDEEEEPSLPQVERELLVRVDKISPFSQRPAQH